MTEQKLVNPALFDTRIKTKQAYKVLAESWTRGTDDDSSAAKLLAPFSVDGIVVSSDGSGLSKMSQEMDLFELHANLSRSKEIIFGMGQTLGGRAIGRWIADNTLMFYPSSTNPKRLVQSLRDVIRRIEVANSVKFGFCVHPGTFYLLEGNLFGSDANVVEELAEEHARPDEILVTAEFIELDNSLTELTERRTDLDKQHPPGVWSCMGGEPGDQKIGDGIDYPHSYSKAFFDALPAVRAGTGSQLTQSLLDRYECTRTVLFIMHKSTENHISPTSLLNRLAANREMTQMVHALAGDEDYVVLALGPQMILLYESTRAAYKLAEKLRVQAPEAGLNLSIGLDRGSLFLFDDPGDQVDVLGSPVNIASKLSEDLGRPGIIQMTPAVAMELKEIDNTPTRRESISRINIPIIEIGSSFDKDIKG